MMNENQEIYDCVNVGGGLPDQRGTPFRQKSPASVNLRQRESAQRTRPRVTVFSPDGINPHELNIGATNSNPTKASGSPQ